MADPLRFFGKAVRATDAKGNPIIVNGQFLQIPENFSLQSQIDAAHQMTKGNGERWLEGHFPQGATGDPQRQEGYFGGFDPRFTDAGNYAFGLTAAAKGFKPEYALTKAETFNRYFGSGKPLPKANESAIRQAYADHDAGRFTAPDDVNGAAYAKSVHDRDVNAYWLTVLGKLSLQQAGVDLSDAEQYAQKTWGSLDSSAAQAFVGNFRDAFKSYPRHVDLDRLAPLAPDGTMPKDKDVVLFVGKDGQVMTYARDLATPGTGELRGIYGLVPDTYDHDGRAIHSEVGTNLNFFNDGTPQPTSVQPHSVTPNDPTGGVDVTLPDGTRQHWWYDSIDGFIRQPINAPSPSPALSGIKKTENSAAPPAGGGNAYFPPHDDSAQKNPALGGLPGLLARSWGDDFNSGQEQPASSPAMAPSPISWPVNQDGQSDENVKRAGYLIRRDVNAPGVWSPPVAPIPSQGPLTLKQAAQAWAASQYPQLAYGDPASANSPAQAVPGTTSPMQPLMQTSPNLSGDLAGWVTGLAGVNPQAPDRLARSPLDEWLDQYVRQNMSAR